MDSPMDHIISPELLNDNDHELLDIDLQSQEIEYDIVKNSVDALYNTSIFAYVNIRNIMYDKSSILKYGFDSIENVVQSSLPTAQKLYSNVGAPTINTIDDKVNQILTNNIPSLSSLSDMPALPSISSLPTFVPSLWVEKVTPHIDAQKETYKNTYLMFVTTAANVYVSLYDKALLSAQSAVNSAQTIAHSASESAHTIAQSASESAAPVIVKYEDFQNSLKSQVKVWNEQIAETVKTLYESFSQQTQSLNPQSLLNTLTSLNANLVWFGHQHEVELVAVDSTVDSTVASAEQECVSESSESTAESSESTTE